MYEIIFPNAKMCTIVIPYIRHIAHPPLKSDTNCLCTLYDHLIKARYIRVHPVRESDTDLLHPLSLFNKMIPVSSCVTPLFVLCYNVLSCAYVCALRKASMVSYSLMLSIKHFRLKL